MLRCRPKIVWLSIFFLGACFAFPVFAFERPVEGNSVFAEKNVADGTDTPTLGLSAVTALQAPADAPIPELSNTALFTPVSDLSDENWYFQAEALFLRRNNQLSNQPVVLDNDTEETLLTTGDLSSDIGYGQRFLLGRVLQENSALELSYFGVIDWPASSTVTSPNNLDIPPDLVDPAKDFDNSVLMQVTNSSRLNNAELNWVRSLSGSAWNGTSVLAGFRYVSFNETFNIHSIDGDDGTASDYNIKATNNLFGAQLGGRVARRYCRWGWDATGKVGLFGNAARQQQFIGDDDNLTELRNTSANGGSVAFVGDINTSLVYQLSNDWALRGGYNLMWIEGAALAGNQLDFSFTSDSGTGINRLGGVFLHGANVGLEARW